MGAVTPAQLAKGALRRLAMAQQEPTPENYARAYAEEAGKGHEVLPERARALLARLAARWSDDGARRGELVAAFMQGQWDLVAAALERGGQGAAAQSQALAVLLERLVRGIERGSRQWTAARKKESLQRVLDSSRSDMQRLQQRLSALLDAWEGDAPLPAEPADAADAAKTMAPTASAPSSEPGLGAAKPGVGTAAHQAAGRADAGAAADGAQAESGHDEPRSDEWPRAVDRLRLTLAAGLPPGETRAAELADRLGRLADGLAAAGPTPARLVELDEVCAEVGRLFAHRHHLVVQAGRLCAELGQGLVELAEDESWARGQAQTLRERLAEGLNARSIRAASAILAETRERHARVRGERDQARDALKQLIHRLLGEIGELGAHAGRFHDNVGRHVQAIEEAQTIDSLAGVVRELLDDSRSVRDLVAQAQQRMAAEQARASRLETQVRALEGELRKLSDEVSTDALTQVANRRGLVQAFAAEAARCGREGPDSPLAVALLDIDNFKKLNDRLGHAAGDKALAALASAVREQLRPVDHLARFGGEEFVVLLPGTAADDALQALTRLQRALSAALFMHEQSEVFVTFSAGVTAWRPGESLEAALERADEALYEAKRSGKNRTCAA
ncbi:MAG: diguanylate cyclase [Rubrivivax sp. SCN 71-131]|nr:MAG: diguanylate cyclase [Rubrivivax sp. SCN 71-131]